MAGDWIKMRTNLDTDHRVFEMARATGITVNEIIYRLYSLTDWLSSHGKYGKMQAKYRDVFAIRYGDALLPNLERIGWCREENGWLMFSGFTMAHAERKSLGQRLRTRVLAAGRCVICGDSNKLEVDHAIPISRGGTSDESNLVCMCKPCNVRKGTRTLDEYMEEIA